MIRYRIDVAATASHSFAVELTLDEPAAEQRVSLPVWIPGSYLVREFGRHLSGLVATQGKDDAGSGEVRLRQVDKATWIASCRGSAPLVLRYRVYAFDTSVRAAYLDAERGFFNGTGLCLRVEGREHESHRLRLVGLPAGWNVATTMPLASDAADDTDSVDAEHVFAASDYDELVDHPFELGFFWRGRFEAAGVEHGFVVTGALPDFDGARLLADTKRICETEIAMWHGAGTRPPFDRYLFMLNATEDGRGGLEHRASTALAAARRDLPKRHEAEVGDGYLGVLGLVAHEYFHAWNVKRLRPRDFARLDYTKENYTELLWFFEGFTSYYDDLTVLRSGLIDGARYLRLVAQTVGTVLATPGRAVQSVAEASFDAWVKYYRADENTPNATVSYYAKGSLVALCLDLTLRSEGRGSLDEVMRRLWHGSSGGPIDEADIAAALEAVGGRSYERELAAWVHGLGELPVEPLLGRFGIGLQKQPATMAQRLGIRVSEGPVTGVKVTHVLRGGAGEGLGLHAGDELIAAGGWRLRRLDEAARFLDPAEATPLLVGRGQRVVALSIDASTLGDAAAGGVVLKLEDAPAAVVKSLVEAWTRG